MTADRRLEWDWHPGTVPENVVLDDTAYLETTYSFELFRSRAPDAVQIGRGSSVYLGVMFDLGPKARVKLGDYVLMNGARIICDSEITIGDHSLISWNVVLMDSYRLPFNPGKRRAVLEQVPQTAARRVAAEGVAFPIRIGSNVWIGFDCCVLPGVTIGEGAIVGARSVVTQDVPAYTIVAGNPARVVRELDCEERKAHAASTAR
jgi:acetyltransferase-like isoleucine patch superfamily enzyme